MRSASVNSRGEGSLWRHSNFLKLWGAQTTSQLGSQITLLALPLTAALLLEASPVQMGLLTAAGTVPHPLLALFAGVWTDRLPRRPILIVADVGRAVLLLITPVAALLGVLHIGLLYAVAIGVAIFTVFFDVAYQSFLPVLVGRTQLVDGNSKLQVTQSVATMVGPGIGGGLVDLVSAPFALLVDSGSFLLSAFFLWRIRSAEPPPVAVRSKLYGDVIAGLRLVLGNPLLRAIAGFQATGNLFIHMIVSMLVLYTTRELGITPGVLGLIFASGSAGTVLGAFLVRYIASRFGPGPTIVGGALLMSVGYLFIPFARGIGAELILGAGLFLSGLGEVIFGVNQMSLRQGITPDRMQGRMNATMRFVTWASRPVGALLGGILAEQIGLSATLVVGAAGTLLAVPWVWFSPLRTLVKQPDVAS